MKRLTGCLPLVAFALCSTWSFAAGAGEGGSQLETLQDLREQLLYEPLPAAEVDKLIAAAAREDVHANEILFKHYTRSGDWGRRDELLRRAMTEYQNAAQWYLVPGWIRRMWHEEVNNRVDPFSEGPTTALFDYAELKEINRCFDDYRYQRNNLVRKVETSAGVITAEFTTQHARQEMQNFGCTHEG